MIDPPISRRAGGGSPYRAAAGVFLVAVIVRAAYGSYALRGGADVLTFDDERWYWALGEAYAAGSGFIGEFGHRAERMPLYPWFLAWFAGFSHGVLWARVTQWVLGGLAAGFACLLAHRVAMAEGPCVDRPLPYGRGSVGWMPLVAGLMVACDPALAGSASLLLTETLHVTALVGLWWSAWPLGTKNADTMGRWILVGLLGGVCVYLREASLAFIALLIVYLLAVRRDRRAIRGSGVVVTMLVLALLPWAYRNSRVIGVWCWTTTRGGISLFDGVRPGATGAGDLADVKDAPEVAGLSEVAWDRHFRTASYRAIADDPMRIAGLVPVKLGRTWSPVLHAAEYGSPVVRLIFAAWYVPFYVLVIAGIAAMRSAPRVYVGLLLPAVGVCLLHSVFVGSVRYRLPAIPALAVLAAIGLAWLIERWRGRAVRARTTE